MKKLIAVIALLAAAGSAPAASLKDFFSLRGKPMYWLSVGFLVAAHAADYQTTETAIQGGFGREGNPLLQQIVLNRREFIGVKIGAGAIPVALELWHLHHQPQYRPLYTIGNFSLAGALGAVAYHNHELSK